MGFKLKINKKYLIAICACLSACAPNGDISNFTQEVRLSSTSESFRWTDPMQVDFGAGSGVAYDVNNDLTDSCDDLFTDVAGHSRGCMQPPALVFSDDRFFLGFTQNYTPIVAGQQKFSLLSNMTSLVNRAFDVSGNFLSVIDSGRGPNLLHVRSSSRNVRYFPFSNGDVLAVYLEERLKGGGPDYVRLVFANIYSAATKTWGTTQQLSTTDVETESGSDYSSSGDRLTVFCAPHAATSGNSAMVAWCEEDAAGVGAGDPTQIRYALYQNGVWSSAQDLVEESVGETVAFPGFHGRHDNFQSLYDADGQHIVTGDYFAARFTVEAGVTVLMPVVEAIESEPSTGQFEIEKDINENVLMCPTLQNMIHALLETFPYNQVGYDPDLSEAESQNLSQYGVSMILNPHCDNDTASTWSISTYYNRSLLSLYRRADVGATDYVVGSIGKDDDPTDIVAGFNAVDAASDPIPPTTDLQSSWSASAAVSVGGDGAGNFTLIRTLVGNYFQLNDILDTAVSKARQLVGHVYKAGLGWLQRAGANASLNEPRTFLISRNPSCYTGALSNTDSSILTHLPCSVKNPLFLQSDSGHGLAFFYQNQMTSYSSDIEATNAHPNRLWFSTYNPADGFEGLALPLDPDTYCDEASLSNDTPVCMTGAVDVTTQDYDTACQTVGEAPTSLPITDLEIDVPPIAAAMNRGGQAVVAFHKKSQLTSTACGPVGVFAAIYDPDFGFGNIEQLDSLTTGAAMHVNAAIASNGTAAVVWEEARPISGSSASQILLYLRVYRNGIWQGPVLMNPGLTLSLEPMFPGISINENGEIVVSFSYGEYTGTETRRQYVRHYYYH